MRGVAVFSLTMTRVLAAIVPTISQRFGQMRKRAKICVVAITFFGEERVCGMMEVVAPLRIQPVAAAFSRQNQARVIQITLRNHMNLAAKTGGEAGDRGLELC